MTIDLSSFHIATGESPISSAKQNNTVDAIQAALNNLGSSTYGAWSSGKIVDPDQIKQGGASAGQVLAWSGSTWAAAASAVTSNQIDRATKTTNVSVTATTEGAANTVLAGNSVAYDGSEMIVEFWAYAGQTPAAGVALTLVLLCDATVVGQAAMNSSAGSLIAPVKLEAFHTPAVGSHTYTVKAFVGSGTGLVNAGTGGSGTGLPMWLRASRA